MTGSDPSQLPVEDLARLLMQHARRDPMLQARSPANSNDAIPATPTPPPDPPDPLPELQRLADLMLAEWHQQTALVDASGDAGSEADEAWPDYQGWPVPAAPRSAWRGMMVAAAVGGLALLIGIAALADHELSVAPSTHVAATTPDVPDLAAIQRRIDTRIAQLRAEAASPVAPQSTTVSPEKPETPTPATATPVPPRTAQVTAPPVAAIAVPVRNEPVIATPPEIASAEPVPVKPLPPVTYAVPIRRASAYPPPLPYRTPIRHYRPVRRVHQRPPAIVIFVSTLSRNVRALFR